MAAGRRLCDNADLLHRVSGIRPRTTYCKQPCRQLPPHPEP